MTEPRILIVGGTSVPAALVAALSDAAQVEVLAVVEERPRQRAILELAGAAESLLGASPIGLAMPHPGYGPPRRGKKGKVLRW